MLNNYKGFSEWTQMFNDKLEGYKLDSNLHPLITVQRIKLFHNPETNPNNAQLLNYTF